MSENLNNSEGTSEHDNEWEESRSYPQSEDNNSSLGSESSESTEESRFKDGQILKFIKVRFPGNARAFPFFIGKRSFSYGQKVVAMSDRGMAIGYVNSFPFEKEFHKEMLPVRSIARVALEEDIQTQADFSKQEKNAEVKCNELVEKYKLDMTLTHVEFTQFGKKAVFYFNAPARVDFRDLVKELVGHLKMRIELRQISVRDRAAALGGIGACGLQTCCSSFLTNYGNASIKMAKNQNLALIPTKINGVCGQIKCCMRYEDEVYSEKRSLLPRENSLVEAKNGDKGKVLRLHLLKEEFEMLTQTGQIRRYHASMYDRKMQHPDAKTYTEMFEHVVNETTTLIKWEEKKTEELPALDESKEVAGEELDLQETNFGQQNTELEIEQEAAPAPEQERPAETKVQETGAATPEQKNHGGNRHRKNKNKGHHMHRKGNKR